MSENIRILKGLTVLKMKKMISLMLCVVCIFANLVVCSAGAAEVIITLNGKEIQWEQNAKPYSENEVMIPVIKLSEVLGLSIQEIPDLKRIVVRLEDKALLILIGEAEYAATNIIELDGKFTYDEPKGFLLRTKTHEKNGDVFFSMGAFCTTLGIEAVPGKNVIDIIFPEALESEENPYLDMLDKISGFYKEKSYPDAIKVADELLLLDEAMMEAYYYKAMSYFYSNDLENAYNTLVKQLSFNPKNELAIYNAACAASLSGKEAEAVDLLECILQLDISSKSSILSDSDFDSIRENEKYKRLMEISIIFGGELLTFDVPPIIVEGKTLLPFRKIFEAFGAEVGYIEETKTVTAEKDGISLSLTIGDKNIMINGKEEELSVPAMIMDGRTLVPVRVISEAMNAEVTWDGENRVVGILTKSPMGNVDYETAKKELDENSVVSVVDGGWPEPYRMPITEGASLIILKNKQALDTFGSLSEENKSKYINEKVYENYALIIGCDPIFAKVIYDGKAYYEGDFDYDKTDEVMVLKYYEKGKPVNVVKQYKSTFNYKDFYLLDESERTTNKIGE